MTWMDGGRRIAVAGLCVAATGLVSAVAALASPDAPVNLIVNGNAEQGEGVNDVNGIATEIPGWTRKGNFTVVKYGAPDFPSPELSTKIRGGLNFFAGGPKNVASSISQDIDVSSQKKLINAGKAKATLSGNVGGYFTQTDWLRATAVFLAGSRKETRSNQDSVRDPRCPRKPDGPAQEDDHGTDSQDDPNDPGGARREPRSGRVQRRLRRQPVADHRPLTLRQWALRRSGLPGLRSVSAPSLGFVPEHYAIVSDLPMSTSSCMNAFELASPVWRYATTEEFASV